MTTERPQPTLYAPITAPGRAAVAVVRLSGARAFAVARRLTGALPPSRRAALRRLADPADGTAIDDALVLAFPAPHSFTGEDVVEFHLHGGRMPVQRLLDALAREPDFAPAGPGAFTRRAFLNGRLDLTRAEAIADLVDAETAAQAHQALAQLDGGFAGRIQGWQRRLTAIRAQLEATLDFADEDDVAVRAAIDGTALIALLDEIERALAERHGERVRGGLRVALTGPPNAGKSSLLNALAGRDVAIVHDRPGTTRDVLAVPLDLAGLPVTLLDTAGLRSTDDPVEAEGVRRAEAAAATADLELRLIDGAIWPACGVPNSAAANVLDVLSKADLVTAPVPDGLVAASVRTADGLDALLAALTGRARALLETSAGGGAPATRARHRHAMAAAAERLRAALGQDDPVLRAEDLRAAADGLATITGERGVEALLDAIFGAFCIGK